MPGEFWLFMSQLIEDYGLLAAIELAQLIIIWWLFKVQHRSEQEKTRLQEKLLELSEKRLADAKEERHEYEDLAKNVNKSIDMLIRVFRKKSGLNGDEE